MPIKLPDLDRTLQQITARATEEITTAVRASIADEVTRLIGGAAPVKVGRASGSRPKRRILCPVPGCGKPGGGPRWGWFCAEHKGLPAAEKRRYQAERGTEKAGKRASGVKPKAVTKRVMQPCPYPGCQNPSKGPRFSWFCAEHRELPATERQRILAERKAKSGGAAQSPPAAKAKPSASGRSKAKAAKAKGKPTRGKKDQARPVESAAAAQ